MPATSEAIPTLGPVTDDAKYQWAPPSHPEPAEDQPLGVPEAPDAVPTPELPPVWVSVEFTRTGPQKLPGFVERASAELVYVQLVHMGFAHHVWLPRGRVSKRTLKPRGRH